MINNVYHGIQLVKFHPQQPSKVSAFTILSNGTVLRSRPWYRSCTRWTVLGFTLQSPIHIGLLSICTFVLSGLQLNKCDKKPSCRYIGKPTILPHGRLYS